jgi:hypothetical protein
MVSSHFGEIGILRVSIWAFGFKSVGTCMMRAYNQFLALEYQTKYRKKITVGEALRLIDRLEKRTGEYLNVKG